MYSTSTSLQVNCNDLSLPWESSDQSFNGYYYMVTIKNNTSPKKEFTNADRYCKQAGRLLEKGFKHVRSAFELDSKQQLHLHLLLHNVKDINRIKTSKYLKTFEPTFVHDIKPILTKEHLYNAWHYLDPSGTQHAIASYAYYHYPNDACDFIDTTEDTINYAFQAIKQGLP